MYYYQSDKLISGLQKVLADNSTAVKNALEQYIHTCGGTAMAETDAYGHTAADNLPLGLYLLVETRVPESVIDTTDGLCGDPEDLCQSPDLSWGWG